MKLQLGTLTLPDVTGISGPVIDALATKKGNRIIIELEPIIEKLFRKMKAHTIEEYIINRFKEFTSAQVFSVLMGKYGYDKIKVKPTNFIQDIKQGFDISVRGLNGATLIYADITGSLERYKIKKRHTVSNEGKKLIIYIPQQLTEYCYNRLLQEDPGNELRTYLHTIIEDYLLDRGESYVFSIQIYGLGNHKEDTIYPFNRSLLQ